MLHAQSVTLQYIQLSNGQIPELMDQLEEVEFPYIFNLLTADEFKTFKSTLMPEQSLRKRASDGVKELVEIIDRAQKLFECFRDYPDSLKNKETGIALRKGRRLSSGKTEVVYLQLLCGLTLQPLVSYKIETAKYRMQIEQFAEIGAQLCAVGVKVAMLWIVAGGMAKAFGYPIPTLPGEVVNNVKNFLDEVNKSSPVEGLKDYKKSGFDLNNQLNDLKKFVEALERNGKMCHCLEEFDKDVLKSRTWRFALKKRVLCDLANYENQVIFISVNLKNMFGAVAEDITLILYGMKTYESNADEQEYNCRTLWKLAMNDCLSVAITAAGGITAILSTMDNHSSNADVQENSCLALMILAYNLNSKVAISKACGKAAIESAMRNYSSNAGVQENGKAALRNLNLRGKWSLW